MTPFVYEDGKDKYEFPSFTIAEYAALQGKIAGEARKQNRMIADEVGFGQMERAKFLKEADPKAVSPGDVEVFLNDDREARGVLRAALNKAGRKTEEAESIIEKLSVYDRNFVAKHVAGIVNLSPVPEEERKATEKMAALVRRHYPGVEVDKLTIGEFYALVEQLVPPEAPETPESWFEKNTVAGSTRKVA